MPVAYLKTQSKAGGGDMITLKELQFSDLEVADSNPVYSGTQTIFLDFDGASGVTYNNDTLDINTNISYIPDSGLSTTNQFQILTDLNNTFTGTGITFTTTVPLSGEYSTIYVGGDGSEFSEYGTFTGLSETIDVGNEIQDDNAFVFSENLSSIDAITETIAHEAGHLVGYTHVGDTSVDELSDFADVIELPLGTTKFTASDGAAYDRFGQSVAVSGTTVIAGSVGDSSDAGSVYSYRLEDSSYTQYKISDSTGNADDWFGISVDSVGDTILVGSDWGTGNVAASGSASFYTWNGSSYDQAKIYSSDGAANDAYGDAVSISANVAVVGAYRDDDDGTSSGSAYVYRWDGVDSYDYNTKLTASDATAGDYFGYAVAVSGDNIAVGAYGNDDDGSNSGGAYVYRWNGSSYDEKIISIDSSAGDYYGYSIAMDGDVVVVGAYFNDDDGNNSGCVGVYVWNSGTEAYDMRVCLTASDAGPREYFGKSVAISGNNIVVGAYGDGANGVASGSIYAYTWNGTSYDEYKIIAEDGSALDFYGRSVDIDGNYIVVGAYGNDDVGYASGSAYSINLAEIAAYSSNPDTPVGDFDGNNKSDVLWRNTDGNVYTWDDGAGSAFGTSLGDSSGYTFLDTGDVNGDDMSDILWKDGSNNVSAWNNGDSTDVNALGTASANYLFHGTGDFDNNDKSDILWRDSSNGNVYVWDDGLSSGSRNTGVASADYTFLGVGDFDQNGKSDILWQHSDGNIYTWDDGAGSSFGSSLGDAPDTYDFLGVGDFNGDGASDILWRDTSMEIVYAWDDGAIENERYLGTAASTNNFQGIGDFDGNRMSDILWRDNDGNVYIWEDGKLGSGWDNLVGTASSDYTALSNIA